MKLTNKQKTPFETDSIFVPISEMRKQSWSSLNDFVQGPSARKRQSRYLERLESKAPLFSFGLPLPFGKAGAVQILPSLSWSGRLQEVDTSLVLILALQDPVFFPTHVPKSPAMGGGISSLDLGPWGPQPPNPSENPPLHHTQFPGLVEQQSG